jgi:hypothetical protein
VAYQLVAGSNAYVVTAAAAPAIVGSAGGVTLTSDPNANFAY